MSATWDSKTTKATPIAADEILIIDTADSRNQKRATLTSLGATLWTRNSGSGFVFPTTLTDKIGIGTITPTEILDILGNLELDGNLLLGITQAAPAGTVTSIYLDTNGVTINSISGKTTSIKVNDTAELIISSTQIDFQTNNLVSTGNILTTNAAGPSLLNEASTSTNPTLIPNRADTDTGIGWNLSDILSIVAGGVESVSFSATQANFNSHNLVNTGSVSPTGSGRGIFLNEISSSTNPVFVPNNTDFDTGIGWNSADILSIVAGGVESVSFSATQANFNSKNIVSLGTLNSHTIPAGTDTFTMLAATQTLTNKTLTGTTNTITGIFGITGLGTLTQALVMGSNNITGVGNILTTNTAGPAILNETPTDTNPTLIPDRANLTTGIGTLGGVSLSMIIDSQAGLVLVINNLKIRPSWHTTSGLTAFAGGGQTSATLVESAINEVSTVATPGDSVKLPSAIIGEDVTVINNGANAMDIFPNTSDQINALAVDAAFSMTAGSRFIFKSYNNTNWVTF